MAVKETTVDKNVEMMKRNERWVAPANARAFDLVAERAEGSYLWDVNGTRYLDFTSGIAVNNVGHRHPKVVAAIKKQLDELIHVSMVTSHPRLIELSEKIAEIAPGRLDSVFLNNSGGEAIDAAIKLARFVTGRPNIVSFTGAFHGRTLLATALTTAKSYYREGYEPFPAGIFQVPYPHCYRCPVNREPSSCGLECFDVFQRLFQHQVKPSSVAAIIMEPVLGEGGYVVPASGYSKPDAFMKRLRELCTEHGIMLIFDEVQTGFGRTGKWFACNHWDIEPDILVVAKGIAAGMPMAGVISRKELMDRWAPGRHGSTYGGNPLACASALASIKVIEDEKLLENSTRMGAHIRNFVMALRAKFACIGDVRGLGLMIGIELIDERGLPDGKRLSRLVDECLKRKLMLLDCGTQDHVIRFLPPLNCTLDEVNESLAIFEQALAATY